MRATLKKWWGGARRKTRSQEIKPRTHDDHALVVSVTTPKRFPRWNQWRFATRVLTSKERTFFWSAGMVACLALAAGLALLLRARFPSVPTVGGTLTEAVVGSPKLINPLFAPLNDVDRDLSTLIYSGLFRLDQHFDPQPDLAERANWQDNSRTLTVTIRKDAFFHDGTPITADDIVFTFEAIKNWRSPLSGDYRGVKTVRVDDQTVQFQLDKTNPNLPVLLTLGILPEHIWGDVSDASVMLADANLRPVGSGPYRVDSFTRDSKGNLLTYHLQRFPHFYGQPPYIKDFIFRFFPDRLQAQNALHGGQVDALAFAPWGDAAAINNQHLATVRLELPQETVAFFNIKNNVLKDERVRRALAMAVDPSELQARIGVHASLVSSPFPFMHATSAPADLDGARALLTSAGWKLKDGDVRMLAGSAGASSTPLALTIRAPNQPDLLSVADDLKRRWSLLGALVDVQAEAPERLLRDAMSQRDYQVLVWNILLSPTQDLTPFWSSANAGGNGLNLSNLQDRDVDAALAAIGNATSTDDLRQKRIKLANAVLAHVPALFLLQPAYTYLVSRDVHGLTDQHLSRPSDRLLNTFDWYISTGWKWR